MLSRVFCACPQGVKAVPITVEVDVRQDKLSVNIVGLPDTATRESKDRLIPAITNSGYSLQTEQIVVNLSPADLRKEGTAYDLPMAIGILAAKGVVDPERVADIMFLGELALDGGTRPVRSSLSCVECAREQGLKTIILPKGNGLEASLVDDVEIYEVASLAQLIGFLRGKTMLTPFVGGRSIQPPPISSLGDLADVKGQALPKRALEIAAAGNHNLLFFGPPGSGKSMLGKRLPGIMSPMEKDEIVEVTRIYSCAGKLAHSGEVVASRPFRAPHHTASAIALVGGGSYPKPGEVTLAHRGVLFLDEFPEFQRFVLEVLRQPLEDKSVTVSRAAHQLTFPADFLLVAAMNPCPCGWQGDPRRRCECSPERIQSYRTKISGPLLDRIDLHVEVANTSMTALRKLPPAEKSETVRARVTKARARQSKRFSSSLVTNANMTSRQLRDCCHLENQVLERFEKRIEALGYSHRAYDKVLRVARTIADLAGRENLLEQDLSEALGYRQFDKRRSAHWKQAVEGVCA